MCDAEAALSPLRARVARAPCISTACLARHAYVQRPRIPHHEPFLRGAKHVRGDARLSDAKIQGGGGPRLFLNDSNTNHTRILVRKGGPVFFVNDF